MANRQIEIENKAMKEILIAMHNLGGQVTRKQVLQELRDNSEVFSEKEIDATRTSKKSGKIYHPFQWKFNFAVKHLILAGFIDTANGHDLELSKRGRNVDINKFDADKDVRSISEAKFPHHKAKNEVVTEKIEIGFNVAYLSPCCHADVVFIFSGKSYNKSRLRLRGDF